jgi:hypothetical protein
MPNHLSHRAAALRDHYLDLAALLDDLIQYCPPPDVGVVVPDGSIRAATEAAVSEYLASDHEPATTREIYAAVSPRIPIGGKNPLSTLSARLSGSPAFTRGDGGWRRR